MQDDGDDAADDNDDDDDKGPSSETVLLRTDKELALFLLNEAKVVTIPGSEFSREGHLRIAYARDLEVIQQGLKAMDQTLGRLKVLNVK